jgi:GNAT superfamily N-acetyltransferase
VWRATPGTAPEAFPEGIWRDAIDDDARHWICQGSDGQLLAAARLSVVDSLADVTEAEQYQRYGLIVDGPVAAPDRVVVAPEAQRHGLAGWLLDVQHQASREAGAVCAVRQASPRMAQLLARRGWQFLGPASRDPRFPGTEFTVSIHILDPTRVECGDRMGGVAA